MHDSTGGALPGVTVRAVHANFGAYNTNEVQTNYGQPSQSNLVAYAPRMLQMGFRFAF